MTLEVDTSIVSKTARKKFIKYFNYDRFKYFTKIPELRNLNVIISYLNIGVLFNLNR